MHRVLTVLLLAAVLFFPDTSSGRDYWGQRPLVINAPDSLYTQYNAHFLSLSHSWARTELQDDEYNWQLLDNQLDFGARVGREVVMHIIPSSGWATSGQERAPDDINRRTPINEDPPERGYSEAIFDFVYQSMVHIYERDVIPVRYLRFGPEPQHRWEITNETFERDVEDYIRCLRTANIAAKTAAAEHNRGMNVSHGGMYYVRQLEREWLRLGNENEELQDSLMNLMHSRYERQAFRGVNDWATFNRWHSSVGARRWMYWTDAMAGQTEWLDWFDVHYHWKPRYIFDELGAFEQVVADSGGQLRPWLAIEAAMQLQPEGRTRFEARFHAGDMARKWVLGMAFGLEALCTPIIGWPEDKFFGLYDPADSTEYLSATTWRLMRELIQPFEEPKDLSDGEIRVFRFREEVGNIDVVWYDALFDTDDSEHEYTPTPPRNYNSGDYYDVLGEELGHLEAGNIEAITVTQEPVIIVWDGAIHVKEKDSFPFQYGINAVYPNPFNSKLTIEYNLRKPENCSITIFDIHGKTVERLQHPGFVDGKQTVIWDAEGMVSGIYYIKLSTDSKSQSRKILLVR